jgi:ligand-binding sensor domain-containing protein
VKIENGKWTNYDPENSGLPKFCEYKIFVDEKDRKWIATNVGLVRWEGDSWTTLSPMNSTLPSFFINQVIEDQEGRIWVGSQDGLITVSSQQ